MYDSSRKSDQENENGDHRLQQLRRDDDNVVRVRGLPWSSKEDDIRTFFSDCDEIVSIHFTYSREGRPSGEAYLELGSAQDVEKALLKHRENMGQRYIEVFHSKRAEMEYVLKRSGKPLEASEANTVVRLRGLPYGCTKEEIFNFFKGMEIAPDGLEFVFDGNGRATGEAYVRFVDKDTAERALDRHMDKIGHRYIEVFRSTEEEMERVTRRPRMLGSYGRSGGGRPGPYSLLDAPLFEPDFGWGYGRMMDYVRGVEPVGRRGSLAPLIDEPYYGNVRGGQDNYGRGYMYSSRSMNGAGRGVGHVVHMRGLPYKATANDIVEFFMPLKVLNVHILFDERGRALGEADVDFPTHEDALEAMKKDHENIGERYIELFLNSVPPSRGKSAKVKGYERDRNLERMAPRSSSSSRDIPGVITYPGLNPYSGVSQMGIYGSPDF